MVVSVGGFTVAGQGVQLGRGYAHQVVTAHLSEDAIRVFHGHELITTVPRVTRKEVVVRKSGEHNPGDRLGKASSITRRQPVNHQLRLDIWAVAVVRSREMLDSSVPADG